MKGQDSDSRGHEKRAKISAVTDAAEQPMNPYATESSRWQAVAGCNPEADGSFVYGVRTTGVFCRPSCASRRPKRENVQFYLNVKEAIEAGYRACKRCRPADESDRHSELVRRACEILENSEQAPDLKTLAADLGVSPYHFHRVFRKKLGVTPLEYLESLRTQRLQASLPQSASVAEAIYASGYGSGSRVYADASQRLGMTPGKYRRGGEGELIRYGIVPSRLGLLLVAGTARGVCTIAFADEDEELEDLLKERFPKATLEPVDTQLDAWIRKTVAYVDRPQASLEIPIDVRGTAFQQRVWKALRDIPFGETASYTDIAEQIGQPTGARAVAGACAANRIALAIPCHRVVRSDGSVSGYRWGVERKRVLLEAERAASDHDS